ncbi:MAG: gliding motility protein GldN [Bacteroidales bacterium]|nr:gliding motility protein GldN [Bacteroidales bacterium]
MKTIRNLLIGTLLISIIGVPAVKAQPLNLVEKREVYDKEHIPKKDPVPYPFIRESDVMYEKTVWRMINLREKMNHPLYYPTNPIGDRKNLTQILLDILKDPLPGHQVFAYRPFLDYEFEQPMSIEDIYKQIGADTIKEPVFDSTLMDYTIQITGIQTSLGDVNRIMVKEKWFFDRRYSTFQVRIIGICPLKVSLREIEDPITGEIRNTGEVSRVPLFWVYYPEIRYYLAKQEVFNPRNDAQRISFDDLLNQRKFSSYIYKSSNVQDNRDISEYAKGMDAMFEAGRLKFELFEWEHDLWEY